MIDHLTKLGTEANAAPYSSRHEFDDRIRKLDDRIRTREPVVQIIMDAVDPQLRSYVPVDQSYSGWQQARMAALTALGLLTVGAEAKQRMQPDAA